MKKLMTVFVMLPLFFAFVGCSGGGGGGSSSSDSDNLFSLIPENYYQPGYMESYSITGTDTAGGRYDGGIFTNTRNKVTLDNGHSVTPIDFLFNLTNTANNTSISQLSTTYYDGDNNPFFQQNKTTMVDYTPASIATLPDTAEIGTIGPLPTWAGSDGSVISGNWSLEKNTSSGNLADLVTMSNMENASGQILIYQEITHTIDKDGIRKSIKITWRYPGTGITTNLSGKKTS